VDIVKNIPEGRIMILVRRLAHGTFRLGRVLS
jgi:hypothetical protein